MRRSTIETWSGSTAFAVALALVAGAAILGNASFAEAADDTKALNSVLKNIEWGDSKDEVLEKLEERRLEKIRNKESLQHNRVEMQQARQRVLEKFQEVEESYTKLDGENTSYKVSVVADEYTKGNNEALLRIKDDVAQRFFFFLDGSLYKTAVAYKQNYLKNIGFEAFVGQVGRKYGRPEATQYAELGGEETLAYARWKDSDTILEVKNEKEFFGTYVMVFSDRKKVKQLEKSDRSFGGNDKKQEGVSKRVERLSVESEADSKEGVVNDMLGESVTVDLSAQKGKSLDKQGPTAGTAKKKKQKKKKQAKASDQEDDEEAEADDEEEREKERDFSDISAESEKDDDELIVY